MKVNKKRCADSPKYSLEVFDEYALIHGSLSSDLLLLLVDLCKTEGFTHLVNDYGCKGFKLIRAAENDEAI